MSLGRWSSLCILCILATSLVACRIPLALVPSLPESTSTLTVRTRLEQPFYSPVDGLAAVELRMNLPSSFRPDERPSLGGGGVLRLFYAPEYDPRYPDTDFYAWPESQGWLGELLPGWIVEETFLSRYPYLDGITVRVGTYGADVGQGTGRLRADVSAVVREAPIAGRELAALPGGGAVEVIGSREGWIRVRLSDGRIGYIDRALFAELPPPTRENSGMLVLRLYRASNGELLREAHLDARTLTDESHVTIRFTPVPDSYRVEYRFTVEAVGSAPGRAVTLWGNPSTGELVYRPSYAPVVLAEVSLDSGRWSGVQNTLEVRFPPIRPTRDTYLRFVIEAGERPLVVHWSMVRPPGNLPLSSQDDPGIWGAVVFNARYLDDVPLGTLFRSGVGRVIRLLLNDPLLVAVYALLLASITVLVGWSWRSRGRRALPS
ncbi:MAG: SH3 domain-containing protein [Thermomicrobium sp.]